MEIRQFRYFVALADELHFGRAAVRAGVSQPSLSQQIRNLERELGVILVERTRGRIRLTPAGTALLDSARSVCSEVDRAKDVVQDVVGGRRGRLVIGATSAGVDGILVPVLRSLREEAPRLDVTVHQLPSGPRLVQQLRDGSIDVALLRGPQTISGVVAEPLLEESFVAVLPADHRLAGSDEPIAWAELADEPFVLWPRGLGPAFHDEVVAACLRHGFMPTIVAQGDSLEAQLALVGAGFGVTIQAASTTAITRVDVAMRPLDPDDPLCMLAIAHSRGRPAPAVTRFRELATLAVHAHEFETVGTIRRPKGTSG